MKPNLFRRARLRKKAGSVYLDVILGVFILSLSAAAFYTVFPKIGKVQDLAMQRSRAMHIANRIIDELQLMRPANITTANLYALNYIDATQTQSPYTISDLPIDDGIDYSPRKVLKNGSATLTVTSIDSGSKRCVITVNWTSEAGKPESFKMGTVVGGYR